MTQASLPFPEGHVPTTRRVNLPRRADWPPIMRPEGTYGRRLEPGPYGVGPIVDIERDRLGNFKMADRVEPWTIEVWEKLMGIRRG